MYTDTVLNTIQTYFQLLDSLNYCIFAQRTLLMVIHLTN